MTVTKFQPIKFRFILADMIEDPTTCTREILITISIIQIETSVDCGCRLWLGIQTRDRRMVGVDETTELWRGAIRMQNTTAF